ncbi:hypothetical protein DBV15_06352 [Temnothorax longispinosus]|uniref:Uncharacterized protein n=1 Tax=Temnothorax longispinosus TaxID=300112 RepID=A0A4S2L1L4_9HYME|nr:hypothetical protein DBV15_06352 [Temnothorax longispinosus]
MLKYRIAIFTSRSPSRRDCDVGLENNWGDRGPAFMRARINVEVAVSPRRSIRAIHVSCNYETSVNSNDIWQRGECEGKSIFEGFALRVISSSNVCSTRTILIIDAQLFDELEEGISPERPVSPSWRTLLILYADEASCNLATWINGEQVARKDIRKFYFAILGSKRSRYERQQQQQQQQRRTTTARVCAKNEVQEERSVRGTVTGLVRSNFEVEEWSEKETCGIRRHG